MQENFMFGKLDYWRIYFSLTVKAALSLLNSCSARRGVAGGRLRSRADSSSSSAASPALWQPPAGPSGLGQSSSWRVFSYVPRKMKPPRLMAAIRGTTPANKLKEKERRFQRMSGCCMAGCKGFRKQSQEKFSFVGLLNPTPLPVEGTCLGFPSRVFPNLMIFKPSPRSSGAEAKVQEATGCAVERGAQTHPHKGCRQMGRVPSSAAPKKPRQRDPLSLLGAPPGRDSPAHPSSSFPVTSKGG